MMELLGKKVSDMEKLEVQRKGVLRQWKKKVQELERSCRLLEEEVDTSRQESMERSVMDEASGEALRMLHRQIASLEQEKAEWERREQMLRVENETLQSLVKERSQDVVKLKEAVWSRDEVLDQGLKVAKEQVDMMGNISLVGVDEEELKRLAEREKKADEEREIYQAREMEWEQDRMELMTKVEEIYMEKINVEEQVEALKEQINVKEEELQVMKSELEAQWGHTETASDTIQELRKAKERAEEDIATLRREKEGLEKERDEFATKYGEAEQTVENMEVDWNESENRRMELESEVHELLDLKDAMEKERKQVKFLLL
jgi:chromosome segregation ATPase